MKTGWTVVYYSAEGHRQEQQGLDWDKAWALAKFCFNHHLKWGMYRHA